MAVESSAVQIRIDVTDTNSAAAVASVEGNLNKLGAAGAGAGGKTKQGLDQVGAAALSSKEKVRLMSEEFGIHVPRAMQSVIAECPQLMGAIGAVSGAMVALGAIQIGAMMFDAAIKGAQKLWQNYLSLNSAADEYQKRLDKSREEDFGNARSIETVISRLHEATTAANELRSSAEASNRAGWGMIGSGITGGGAVNIGLGIAMLGGAHKDAGKSVKKQEQADQLTPHLVEERHQLNEQQIEYNHAQDDTLRGHTKINAERKKRVELAAEERRHGNDQDRLKGNPITPDSGAAKEKLQDDIAQRKADAETHNLNRTQAQEMMHLRQEAVEASLRGTALIKQQEADAIEQLKFKDIDRAKATEYIREKFHAEEMKRLQEQQEQTEKMVRTASMAGMTGIQRTQAEGENRVADINVQADKEGLDPGQRQKRIEAANRETDAQIAAEQRSFAEEIDTLADASATHQVEGFARIHAEAAKQLDALQKKFDETYGRMDRSTLGGAVNYGQGLAQLQKGQDAIGAGEHGQSKELTDRNKRETEQIEEQARVKFLSAEKQKTAAIVEELADRLAKYKDELNSQQISQEDYDRRAAAAQQTANAQMVEAATEARKKMAGEFEGFFKGMEDPKRYMKELGDKAAGNAAATLFQHFQQRGQNGQAGQGSSEHTSLFGDFKSNFGLGKKKTPDEKALLASGKDSHHTAQGMFSVAQATIHIGSASIAGGGIGSGSTAAGNRSISADGSMSLLAPSGSVASPEAGTPTGAGGSAWGAAGSTSNGFTGGSAGIGAGAEASGSGSNVSDRIKGGIGNVKQSIGFANGLGIIGKLNDSDRASKLFGGKLFGSGSFFGGAAKGSEASSGAAGTALSASNASSGSAGISLPQDAPGTATSGAGSNLPSTGGGATGRVEANAQGAVEGGMGVYGASRGGGGIAGAGKGALSGAEAGASIGTMIMPGVGTAVGAAIGAVGGAIVGVIGDHEAPRVYDLKTVRPHITGTEDSYKNGQMDYLSAYSDLQSLQTSAFQAMSSMGFNARSYRDKYVLPEIKEAEGKLTAMEKAGRSQYSASSASYATGTPNVPETGYSKTHAGERIFSAPDNQQVIKAITEGNQNTMPAASSSMGDVHLHVHAIDAKSSMQFLQANKHNIRTALNDSLSENSGGGL